MGVIRYDIIEKVWNSYEVRNIEKSKLDELFEKHNTKNIWKIQNLEPELQISVELSEACFEFIESNFKSVEIE